MLSIAALFAYWSLASCINGAVASSLAPHLRGGVHFSLMQAGAAAPPTNVASTMALPTALPTVLPKTPPPQGLMQPAGAPAAAPQGLIADVFARMDVDKDGKVDRSEFVHAQQTGTLSLSPAPAPVGVASGSPAAAPGMAPGPAPAPSQEELPAHMLIPPPLPENIPEPPPPPRPPPAEPGPPPQPPSEGQLIGPPPSQNSMEASGNVHAMMAAGVPGLDLDGSDPLQAPNTPPPLPAPIEPPELPKVFMPFPPPQSLPSHIMKPAPVAFGVDVARMLPEARNSPLKVVPMPDFSLLSENPRTQELMRY